MTVMEYTMMDGRPVFVEVEEVSATLTEDARPGRAVQAGEAFEDALVPLRNVAEGITRQMESLARKPNEVTVEFGLKFSGEAKIPVLTKVGGEAALKVTMKWTGTTG